MVLGIGDSKSNKAESLPGMLVLSKGQPVSQEGCALWKHRVALLAETWAAEQGILISLGTDLT